MTKPLEFELAQNYPNPFNPQTSIFFNIPEASHVTVEIYNIYGQLIRTLIDSDMSAGRYDITWDGRAEANDIVTSGIYMYTLTSGNFKTAKKMIFLR